MKILQGFLLLLVTAALVHAADKKTKKTEKAGVKRQIGYGLEAIPGVAAVHAPLEEYFAVGRPTAHGGVQHLGIIHNGPALDSIPGFTSHGFDALQSGYGIYASPHAIIAAPFVNVQGGVPKTVHQLDQGWKGIDPGHGHGSIKHGHQIAQSLATKPAVPVHENVFEVGPFVPQYDFGKGKHGGYNQNTLVPHSGFGSSGFSDGNKGFVSFPNVKAAVHTPHHGTPAPKGYSFSTLHAPQTPVHAPHTAYDGGLQHSQIPAPQAPIHASHTAYGGGFQHTQIPVHNSFSNGFHHANNQNYLHGHNIQHSSHKAHSGHAAGQGMVHGSINHGHHLAKNFHVSTGHSGIGVNHGHGKGHIVDTKHYGRGSGFHGNVHSAAHGHKKVGTLSNSYHVPSGHGLTSSGQSHVPSGPSRVSLHSGEYLAKHDASSRASSAFNSDFNSPAGLGTSGSSEHSDSPLSSAGHTNGHGGGQKATSFQSFVIHSYKPAQTLKKHEYDSHESEENYSGPSYSSGQAQSGESHF